ncbi:MAG: hypothetical protein U0031_16870 [Thermomicrobiales bacterium]
MTYAGTATARSSTDGLDNTIAIASNACHALALRTDGTVWGWGCNSEWDLGATAPDGADSTTAPIQATGLDQVRSIAFGNGHGLTARADGTVWAWGANDFGQIGVATDDCPIHHLPCSQVPVPVPGLSDIKAVAASDRTSFAVKADGTVLAWGRGQFGELGTGSLENSATPAVVPGITDVVMLSGGNLSVLALRSDGTVWTWGGLKEQFTPTQIPGLAQVVAIAAGSVRNLALTSDGAVWTWGWVANPSPMQVTGLAPMVAIATGSQADAALAADGTIWTWNWDRYTDAPRNPPERVEGVSSVVAIAMNADDEVTMLKADGTAWTWRPYSKIHQVPAPA